MSRPVFRDAEVMAEVGRRLRAARHNKGWSLEAAACHADLANSVIGSYERGNRAPSISALMHLADVYGVHVVTLLPGAPIVDPARTLAVVDAMRVEVEALTEALVLLRETAAAEAEGAA